MTIQHDLHNLMRMGVPTTPLTRLNYFDGLFLRAEHLRREQDGMRNLVFQSNVAGGQGVVHGLDVSLEGDSVVVQPGLAIDGRGRVCLLVSEVRASLDDLLGERRAPVKHVPGLRDRIVGRPRFEPCIDLPERLPPGVTGGTAVYAVVVRHAESACGWEEVRGRACEDACDASMERPYLVEHATVGLCPLHLSSPLPASSALTLTDRHLRSRIAAAVFADELARAGSWISGEALRSPGWCLGASPTTEPCGEDVPVGLLAVRGTATLFLDPWPVRRERMEAPPRRSWAGRVRMRPWDVFLAQVLQFQCHLAEVLGDPPAGGGSPADPCGTTRTLLGEAISLLDAMGAGLQDESPTVAEGRMEAARREEVRAQPSGSTAERFRAVGGYQRIAELRRLARDLVGPRRPAARILVDGGIVELPPAGYLPVDPRAEDGLRRQVADLLGPGVDLRLCAVRADQVAGELEAAQHLDRISLLRGIDNPARREAVDILVPDGEPGAAPSSPGRTFEVDLAISRKLVRSTDSGRMARRGFTAAQSATMPMQGVARLEPTVGGGIAFHAAVAGGIGSQKNAEAMATVVRAMATGEPPETFPQLRDAMISATRLRATAAEVRRFVAARQAGQTKTTMYSQAPSRPEAEPVLGWVSLTADGNPFTMGDDDGAAFSLELAWYSPVRPGHSYTLDATGRLTVDEVEGSAVTVVLEGYGRQTFDGEVVGEDDFRTRVRIDLGEGTIRIADFHRGEHQVMLDAEWAGAPVYATASFDPGFRPYTVRANLREGALDDPGNVYRDMAANTLTVFEGAGSDDFAERAGAKLFPPPDRDADVLRATLDWVLFRRRTRHECVEPDVRTPVVDRSVMAWVASAATGEEAAAIERNVRVGNYGQVQWAPLGPVAFAGETAQLRTTDEHLRSRWNGAGASELVWLAGYAAVGSSAQSSALDRLRAVVRALAPDARLARLDSLAFAALPPAPPAFAEPGIDAVAFFVSLPQARPDERERPDEPQEREACVHMYVETRMADETWKGLHEGRPEAREAAMAGEVSDVGIGRKGQDDWETGGLGEAMGGRGVREAVVWVAPDFAEATDESERRGFLVELFGSAHVDLSEGVLQFVETEFDDECPMLIFVRPAQG